MGDPPGAPRAGVVRGEVRPHPPAAVHPARRVPQAARRQPRRALPLLRARRHPVVPPGWPAGPVRLPRHDVRHPVRPGPRRRAHRHADPDPHRRVRARSRRRGGHPHRSRVVNAHAEAAQLGGARARDGAARHTGDALREVARTSVSTARRAGPRTRRDGAATAALERGTGAQARASRHVPHLRRLDRDADVAATRRRT